MITAEERAELVRYRLQRAGETLDEAEILLKAGKLPGAVNRIYYAVFYAASALLLKHGLSSVKHAGLISLFHKEIVNKGVLEKEFGRILERAYANRTEGDYKDRRIFEMEQVESLFLKEKDLSKESKYLPGTIGPATCPDERIFLPIREYALASSKRCTLSTSILCSGLPPWAQSFSPCARGFIITRNRLLTSATRWPAKFWTFLI